MPATAKAGPSGNEGLMFAVLGGLVVLWVWVAGSAHLGGVDDAGKGWAGLPLGLMLGKAQWTTEATVWLAGTGVVVIALAVFGWWLWRRLRHGGKAGTRVDGAARLMGKGKDIEPLSRKHAAEIAERLHVNSPLPGFFLGYTTTSHQELWSSWENTIISIWGPRTGKTSTQAIPRVMDCPGAVLATSNKRDLTDATRDPRAKVGDVWVFDPEDVVGERHPGEVPPWWWNPLSYVADDATSVKLADHFVFSTRKADSKGDAYFDDAGRNLLADIMLASALDAQPITTVYAWLTRRNNDRPIEVLKHFGYHLQADRLTEAANMAAEQQDGVYGTASKAASCLTMRSMMPWINPTGPGDKRPQINPAEFVQGANTLYSLSKESSGVAAPIVTALTVAVAEEAEKLGARQPGGRLVTPMLCCLDEAANVCKWGKLPDLYSHYGSRGIIIDTYLQSWSQGVDTWSSSGMRKMYSAANVRIYGGGLNEAEFLENMAKIIGQFDRQTSSVSNSEKSRSVSNQTTRARIMDIEDLAALPLGRAVVMASGAVPCIINTVRWTERPDAGIIQASIKAHEPH